MTHKAILILAALMAALIPPQAARAQGQGINSVGKNKTELNAIKDAIKGGVTGGDVAWGLLGSDIPLAPAKVTPQNLAEFLRKLGFEPNEVTPTIGIKYCVREIKEDGWKYAVEVKTHDNGAMWMIAALDQAAEGKRPDAAKLMQLLEANDTLAPCFFFYRAADRRVCMKLEVIAPNGQGFHNDLLRMQNAVRASQSLWTAK